MDYIFPTYKRTGRVAGKIPLAAISFEESILPDPSSYGIFPSAYDDKTSGQSLSTWMADKGYAAIV